MQRKLLTQAEAAELLRVSEATLERDRCINGEKPRFPYIRMGRTIRYDLEVLERVIDSACVGNAA